MPVQPVDSACRRGVPVLARFHAELREPARERPAEVTNSKTDARPRDGVSGAATRDVFQPVHRLGKPHAGGAAGAPSAGEYPPATGVRRALS